MMDRSVRAFAVSIVAVGAKHDGVEVGRGAQLYMTWMHRHARYKIKSPVKLLLQFEICPR